MFCRVIFLAGIAVGLCTASSAAQTGSIDVSVPESPDATSRYVFYLHGQIIETQGRRPTHPQFGIYEYDEVLRAFARSGAEVISEQRPPNTDVGAYAQKVVDQVHALRDAGVPLTNITVVGFSKGGRIAIAISSILQDPIQYVFLAACGAGVFEVAELRVRGRVLSIYEASDEIGVSCEPLLSRSPAVTESKEVRIDTGARHGAFYQPRRDWLSPVLEWLKIN